MKKLLSRQLSVHIYKLYNVYQLKLFEKARRYLYDMKHTNYKMLTNRQTHY